MRAVALAGLALLAAAGCSASEAPDDLIDRVETDDVPRIALAADALAGAYVPTVHPMPMSDAGIRKVIGAVPYCAFRYTSSGRPVLAWNASSAVAAPTGAVVKLNGALVAVQPEPASGSTRFAADEVVLTLTPQARTGTPAQSEARLVFELQDRLRTGYGGYVVCPRP